MEEDKVEKAVEKLLKGNFFKKIKRKLAKAEPIKGKGRRISEIFVIKIGRKSFIIKPNIDKNLSDLFNKLSETTQQIKDSPKEEKEYLENLMEMVAFNIKIKKDQGSSAEREFKISQLAIKKKVNVPKTIFFEKPDIKKSTKIITCKILIMST